MNCLSCGRQLPKVDEMAAKLGKTVDLDMVVCGCDSVMVYEAKTKTLRPPKINECQFFVQSMLPQALAKMESISKPKDKCAECGEWFSRTTFVGGPNITPNPGNYCMCPACGAVGVFDEKLEIRRPTKEEQETENFKACLQASADLQVMLATNESKKP